MMGQGETYKGVQYRINSCLTTRAPGLVRERAVAAPKEA